MLYYPRTRLATALAEALQGEAAFSDAPNGLFLAAPRRTGKSTFLQSDLMPELARRCDSASKLPPPWPWHKALYRSLYVVENASPPRVAGTVDDQ